MVTVYTRRFYYFSKVFGIQVPAHNLSYFPDGFTIRKVGQTGVAVIDGFCTPAEAHKIIELARGGLHASGVQEKGKFVLAAGRQSETAGVFGPGNCDPTLLPIACRAAALVGLPYTHLEAVYVTRYQEGGHYNEHVDYGDHYNIDRLYTILLYLNDVQEEHGGATAFPRLNIKVQPKLGRAVSWTNLNPDRSPHLETSHAALPVLAGGEKWAIQFWFHPYRMFDSVDLVPPQIATGKPISPGDALPDGAAYFERPPV